MIFSQQQLIAALALTGAYIAFSGAPAISQAAPAAKIAPKYETSAFVLSLVEKVNKTHAELAKKAAQAKTQPQAAKKPLTAAAIPSTPKTVQAASLPATTTLSLPKTPQLLPIEEQNRAARKALVNIICTTKAGGSLRPISGSGVIVDPRGIILTNAHVAQFFLLKDYLVPDFVTCTIRTGSPAQDAYRAKLIYLPEIWISQNAENLARDTGIGTGEHDFAFLAITETVSGAALPSSFEYLKSNYAFDVAPANYPVLLAGYPAELVGNVLTARDLHAITSASTISQAYFFEGGSPERIDLITLAPNILAQAGSSGGAVISRYDTSLLALLVTTSKGATTGDKMLNAVNLAHIHRDLLALTGKSFPEMLLGDIDAKIKTFEATLFVPLREKLVAALNAN